MITSLPDLDAALRWMRRVGYKPDPLEVWPMRVDYGGFSLVCAGEACPWKICAIAPSYPQPHNFLVDAIVAPWVAEQIMALARSVHEQKDNT